MTPGSSRSSSSRFWRAALVEGGLVGAAVLAAMADPPPTAVERWFSTGVYPSIQRTLTRLTNSAPVALLDVLLIAGLSAVALVLVRAAHRAWRRRQPMLVAVAFGHLLAGVSMVYLVFLGVWGFNYRRVPLADRLILEDSAPTASAVQDIGRTAALEMNRLRASAHALGWGAGDEWRDPSLRRAFQTVQQDLADVVPAEPGRLKHTILGAYFRGAGVDGMVNPFGLEVLANPDLLPFERPFVAAHEWAHLAGYATESEASFVGWLVCLRGNAAAQYSGWLFVYWQVRGEIGPAERAALAERLESGPRADLDAIAERLRRGQWPALRRAGWAVYDQYLKANRVDEGIRSYSEVLTLIARARLQNGAPVRRALNR